MTTNRYQSRTHPQTPLLFHHPNHVMIHQVPPPPTHHLNQLRNPFAKQSNETGFFLVSLANNFIAIRNIYRV